MPQLVIGDFAPQLVWLAITFIALYFIMARVALPRIANVLEERRDRIATDLDTAAQLKTDTDKAIANYEQALAEARAKSHEIVQATREKLNTEIDAERKAVEAQIAEKTAEAEARIEASKKKALAQVNQVAGDAAGEIVRTLIGEKLSVADLEKAVSETAKA